MAAGRKAKTKILDEFCAVCGYHRKYAIRLLNQRGKPRKKRRPGRKPIYASPELLTALKRIWFASDQMCSKKLKAAIPLWLPYYATVYKALTAQTQGKLLAVSAATIDRLLKPVRVTLFAPNNKVRALVTPAQRGQGRKVKARAETADQTPPSAAHQ